MMQILVFGKRQDLHHKHYRDQASQAPGSPAGPPVEGVVAAVGMDRIHLNTGSATEPFRCENPGQYQVGQRLRITYAAGDPPSALKVEKL